jgi:hypothetical protein
MLTTITGVLATLLFLEALSGSKRYRYKKFRGLNMDSGDGILA